MLRKVVLLLALLGVAFAVMMLTTRTTNFRVENSLEMGHPISAVWQVMTQVEEWPAWWPGMERARLEGKWGPGAEIEMVLKGTPEQSTAGVESFVEGRQITWVRPGVLGSATRTSLRLETAAGGSLVHLESSIFGPQAFLARFTGEEEFAKYHRAVLDSLNAYLAQKK